MTWALITMSEAGIMLSKLSVCGIPHYKTKVFIYYPRDDYHGYNKSLSVTFF